MFIELSDGMTINVKNISNIQKPGSGYEFCFVTMVGEQEKIMVGIPYEKFINYLTSRNLILFKVK